MTQAVSMQCLIGPACGALEVAGYGARGVQGEHRGGLEVATCSPLSSLLAPLG